MILTTVLIDYDPRFFRTLNIPVLYRYLSSEILAKTLQLENTLESCHGNFNVLWAKAASGARQGASGVTSIKGRTGRSSYLSRVIYMMQRLVRKDH